jgi:uncharacterized membrane protein
LSEEWKRLFRNAHISLAVGLVLFVIGFVFVHDSETAVSVLTLVTFLISITVLTELNTRDERRRKGPPQAH